MIAVARSAIEPAAWDALVRASPDGWVFGLTAWLDMIGRVPRWELEDHSFAIAQNGRLLAAVPLHHVARNRRVASSGWGWIGPLAAGGLHPAHESKVLKAVHREIGAVAARVGAEQVDLATPAVTARSIASRWGVSPFATFGYDDTSTLTQVIDLRPDTAVLWRNLSQDARYQIRRAEKMHYSAAIESWSDMLDEYYAVHQETYARSALPPHPREYFAGFAQELATTGHVRLMVGRDAAGIAVAFHNTLQFGIGAAYTTGCGSTAHRDSGIDYLLFWRAMLAAKSAGADWYEAGEVHVSSQDAKLQGLATFKSKFGGALHRYFRGVRSLAAAQTAAPPSAGVRQAASHWAAASRALAGSVARCVAGRVIAPASLRRIEGASPPREAGRGDSDTAQAIKATYASGELYDTKRICAEVDERSGDFVQVLLKAKLDIVRWHYKGGLVLDLCCATGRHLFALSDTIEQGVGIDFAERYLHHARAQSSSGNLSFLCADAKHLPLQEGSVSLIYSLSSLYAIPGVADVFTEIGRVLRPGGVAVLDLGNSRSLNAYCLRVAYAHWPPVFPITVAEMRRLCAANGLAIRDHRSFQLLPLWAGEPRWLRPLLHPAWKRLLQRRVGGRMLDEWMSSLPLLRGFAFRHILVCEKG